MSTTQTNIALIQTLYHAFGQGDVPGVLACVADQVQWRNPYGIHLFPGQWGKVCHNHAEIVGFFQAIGETLDVRRFEPLEWIVDGDKVVVLIQWEGVVRRTQAPYSTLLIHVWTIRDGKVVDYIGFDDPSAYVFG